jgi:hypothetical protein
LERFNQGGLFAVEGAGEFFEGDFEAAVKNFFEDLDVEGGEIGHQNAAVDILLAVVVGEVDFIFSGWAEF